MKIHSFRQKVLSYCVLIGLLSSPYSNAAIQGEEGLSSTGQIVLRFSLLPSYQISRVDDIILNVTDFDQPILHKEKLCIRGPKNSSYTITAASETSIDFALADGAGNTIPYSVRFYNSLDLDTADPLLPEERSRSYPVTHTNRDCDGQDNTALEIFIEPDDLKNAEMGTYNGVLLLTVGSV